MISFVKSRQYNSSNIHMLIRIRLRKAYEDVLFLDIALAHEADVESSLWLKVHHKKIEAYKSGLNKVCMLAKQTS